MILLLRSITAGVFVGISISDEHNPAASPSPILRTVIRPVLKSATTRARLRLVSISPTNGKQTSGHDWLSHIN